MKISKERLKELIAEEMMVGIAVPPDIGGMMGGVPPTGKGTMDRPGYAAKQNLWKIAEYAHELYELVQDDDCLEPWIQEKLSVAAYIMDSVGHYIEYETHRKHEAVEGDVDTLEPEEQTEPVGVEEPDEEEYEFEFEPESEEDEEDYEEEEEVK